MITLTVLELNWKCSVSLFLPFLIIFQDIEETNSFIPRKDKSSETEKKEQGGLSDSSSEDLNFQEHLEGLRYIK